MIRFVAGELQLRKRRASGPFCRGRHKCLQWARNPGLLGQEPGKPANVLAPNGGDHAVSWNGCSCEINGLVLARRWRRSRREGQNPDHGSRANRLGPATGEGRATRRGTGVWEAESLRTRRAFAFGREASDLQPLPPARDRGFAQEDRQARCLLASQDRTERNDAAPRVHPDRRCAAAAGSLERTRLRHRPAEGLARARFGAAAGCWPRCSTAQWERLDRKATSTARWHRRAAEASARALRPHGAGADGRARRDRRTLASTRHEPRAGTAPANHPGYRREGRANHLCVGRRHQPLPHGTPAVRLCGADTLRAPERRLFGHRPHHQGRLKTAAPRTHAGRTRAFVSLPIRELSTLEGQTGSHRRAARKAKNSRRGSGPAHLAHGLLRPTRPDRLQPSSIEIARRDDPSSLIKLVSEADAGEDEGDQIASSYGSRPAMAGARSPRIDWSVLLPVRQHVPSHFGEPEHEWKDENPWPSAPDLPDPSDHNTCHYPAAPASGSALAKVRAETLTRIMEGVPNDEHEESDRNPKQIFHERIGIDAAAKLTRSAAHRWVLG